MSSSEDDIYAWNDGEDAKDKAGGITGGYSNSPKSKEATRASSRGRGKTLNYNDPSSEDDEVATNSVGESDEVEVVSPKRKRTPTKKRASPRNTKSVLESLNSEEKKDSDDVTSTNARYHDVDDRDLKPPAHTDAAASYTTNDKNSDTAGVPNPNTEGINVMIPHSLLNKHQGAGRNECTMLVQVDAVGDNHLDFHGQSGAVGRFEADEEGVTLDLKGYQYRGTIRPGPTAMVVALTRDGQFKVEAITDEFVTLDTDSTNIMTKLDAVVEGEMDDGYRVRDDNVNRSEKKKAAKDGDEKEDIDEEEVKKGAKRKSSGKSNSGAPKKLRVSALKNK